MCASAAIEYHRLQNDQGICIHVFGGPDDQQDEVLRFDCFERQPHYHYVCSKNDHYVPLDTAAEGDPVQWTLARLRTRLPAMLLEQGFRIVMVPPTRSMDTLMRGRQAAGRTEAQGGEHLGLLASSISSKVVFGIVRLLAPW